jgi:hypothetical protein
LRSAPSVEITEGRWSAVIPPESGFSFAAADYICPGDAGRGKADPATAEAAAAQFDAALKRMNSQSTDAAEMPGMAMGIGPPRLPVMPDALLRPC